MRNSILAGVALPVPWWVEILQAAEDWGTPPWEIMRDQGKAIWVIRWRTWKRTVNGAQNEKSKH